MITLRMTGHGIQRMQERGISREQAEAAVNNFSMRVPGKGGRQLHHGPPDKDGSVVVVVTSWPPHEDGTVMLVTCYIR